MVNNSRSTVSSSAFLLAVCAAAAGIVIGLSIVLEFPINDCADSHAEWQLAARGASSSSSSGGLRLSGMPRNWSSTSATTRHATVSNWR